jgi:hypothetical protein
MATPFGHQSSVSVNLSLFEEEDGFRPSFEKASPEGQARVRQALEKIPAEGRCVICGYAGKITRENVVCPHAKGVDD